MLDPSGKGVAGARLSLVTDAWSDPQPQAVSGIDGSFRFKKTVGDFWRNFAAGGSATPRVQAVVLATHDAFGVAWVNLRVVAKDGKPALGGEYPLSLRMVADRPIEGRLLDDQGRPVAGAMVWVEQLYAVPAGDLSPIIDALRRFDLEPYQRTHPRIGPQPLRSDDGDPLRDHRRRRPVHAQRRRSRPPGQPRRDRPGDGVDEMDRPEPRRGHRGDEGGPRTDGRTRPDPGGPTAAKAAPDRNPGVQVYGPTFDLRVDPAGTISGVVRDATTGRPVQGAMVYIPHDGCRRHQR